MHRILCFLCSFVPGTSIDLADSYPPRTDIGIICIDLETGTPLWEHFPDRLGICELATDGKLVYMIMGEREKRTISYPPGQAPETIVRAVDLRTHQAVRDAVLPDRDKLTLEAWPQRAERLPGGDRIEANPYEHDAIRIMKGDTSDVRFTVPVAWYYSGPWLFKNLITVSYDVESQDGSHRYRLFAYDANRQELVWEKDIGHRRGAGRGKEHIYFAGRDGLLAVEGLTGKIVWNAPTSLDCWGCTAVQVGQRVLAVGHPSYSKDFATISCFDAATGRRQWTFETECWLNWNTLLVHDGKLYTQIVPTPYMKHMRDALSSCYQAGKLDAPLDRYACSLPRYFADLGPAASELHLRAWHSMGDAAGLPILRTAAALLPSDKLRRLAAQLVQSFPPTRDPGALLNFLEGEFDRHPELRSEIRRITEQINMLPSWYGRATVGFGRCELPEYALRPVRQRLIDRYLRLMARTFEVPPSPHTQRRYGASNFEDMLTFRRAFVAKKEMRFFTDALFLEFPQEACAWALEHESELSSGEICSWIDNAPLDWLMQHTDLLGKWLRHDDSDIQFTAARRLYRIPEQVAVPLAVDLLTEFTDKDQAGHVRGLYGAITRLGQLERRDLAPLLKRYLHSPARRPEPSTRPTDLADVADGEYPLRDAASRALARMGIDSSTDME